MKERITKYIHRVKSNTVYTIIGFTIALSIALSPFLAILALDVLIPNDVCLWNDGGTCPFCGW